MCEVHGCNYNWVDLKKKMDDYVASLTPENILSLIAALRVRLPVENTDCVVTRSDLTVAVNAALIATMSASAVGDWAMSTLYGDSRKMNTVQDVRLFSPSMATLEPATFCVGVGGFRKPGSEGYVEAVWGTVGVYAALVAMKQPFFNAQMPLAAPAVYVPLMYAGMRKCSRAIIVCYPPPWNLFFSAAVLVYYIGCGSAYVATLVPPGLEACETDSGDAVDNIAGTYHGMFSARDRRSEVAGIISSLTRAYANVVTRPRVFSALLTSPPAPTLLEAIAASVAGEDRERTLAGGIRGGMFGGVHAPLSIATRDQWRTRFLMPARTDIGVCLHYIFMLGMSAEATDVAARYEMSKVTAL